jgi:hypothetical protein
MKPEASIVPVIGYWFKTSPIPNFSINLKDCQNSNIVVVNPTTT